MCAARWRGFFRHLANRDRRAKILPEARPGAAQGVADLGSADRAQRRRMEVARRGGGDLAGLGSAPRGPGSKRRPLRHGIPRSRSLSELEEPTARRYPARGNGSRGRRAAGRDPRRDGRPGVAAAFDTGVCFYAIRLEPYLVATGRVHTDLAPRLEALASATLATKRALVHGDVSPKNILVGPDGPVFIDSECAWYGEPAFDLAFCLNHLLLKCLWRPESARGFLRLFDRLTETYLAGVTWQPRAEMEALAAALLPALLLGRIDGKSPIEYVTEEREKNQVRDFARRYIATRVDRLDVIRDAWAQQVHA